VKKISYIIFVLINSLDKTIKFLFNKNFKYYLYDYLRQSYSKIKINNKSVSLFTPSQVTKWRADTFYKKEPETLDWIDEFEKDKNILFWDIGANIGLYSIYASVKNEKTKTIAFEPSTANLNILSRNISKNKLENNISIFQLPLTEEDIKFNFMNEKTFDEGGALNAFGVDYDYKGNKFVPETRYKILGVSINYILKNNILEIPDYIKIDVDGIEHLILKGARNYLSDKKIKSILLELDTSFSKKFEMVKKILEDSGFKLKDKKRAEEFYKSEKFKDTWNFIFYKI